jgi:hypothetical protein
MIMKTAQTQAMEIVSPIQNGIEEGWRGVALAVDLVFGVGGET